MKPVEEDVDHLMWTTTLYRVLRAGVHTGMSSSSVSFALSKYTFPSLWRDIARAGAPSSLTWCHWKKINQSSADPILGNASNLTPNSYQRSSPSWSFQNLPKLETSHRS